MEMDFVVPSFKEMSITLEMIMRRFNKYHISGKNELQYEKLDIDLSKYLSNNNKQPMLLSDIRVIIQQMATALEVLKRIGVIHGNVKPDNLMMVDHQTRPFGVKLIDFSLAIHRSEAQQVKVLQEHRYRAPEMFLGLPFSEAIDMWSLGCVMLLLICGCELDVNTEQDMRSEKNLTDVLPILPNGCKLQSLDDLKKVRLESDNEAEAEEREKCIELLKAMLEIDPNKRITPSEVLSHPFIDCISYPWTREYLDPAADQSFYLNSLDFEILDKLGAGIDGEIRKCRNNHTGEMVAVKRPNYIDSCDNEVCKLNDLMVMNTDLNNIVRLHGWFNFTVGKAPVFEVLDNNLWEMNCENNQKPMLLSDIRVIVQQMATALETLSDAGIIHTNIKPNNIMAVDCQKRPLEVKLIDFGLAMYRSEAKQGMTLQGAPFRAPEMYLGLPFSEAIDMWSLGCVMAWMLCGHPLFSGMTEEKYVLPLIVELLGQPANHLLNDGRKTKMFFKKAFCKKWKLKSSEKNLKEFLPSLPNGCKLQSLDDLKKVRLESDNEAEAEEREKCIELLKAMLEIDPNKRITPSEVLSHPFIDRRKDYGLFSILPSEKKKKKSAQSATQENTQRLDIDSGDSWWSLTSMIEDIREPAVTAQTRDDTADSHPDRCSQTPTISPSGVVVAAPENTVRTADVEYVDGWWSLTSTTEDIRERVENPITCVANRKKKKKNPFRRFLSWMKKRSFPCIGEHIQS